jgi:hypothetical protein
MSYVITLLLFGVLLALVCIYRKLKGIAFELKDITLEVELIRTHHFKANRNAIDKQEAIDEENMEKIKANCAKMNAASKSSQARIGPTR